MPPSWLRSGKKNINDISAIAIALYSNREGGVHTGILHRDFVANKLYFLHLADHNQLKNEDVTHGIDAYFVIPPINVMILRALAGFCRNIAQNYKNGEMKYSFFLPEHPIWSDKGRLMLEGLSNGLTCSHFVISIFEYKKIKLIERSEWPSRPEDVNSQMNFILSLCRRSFEKTLNKLHRSIVNNNSEELGSHILEQAELLQHVEKMIAEIGSIRYRPEEVVAGASSTRLPASFSYAESNGSAIRAFLA